MSFRELYLSLDGDELVVRIPSTWLEPDERRAKTDIDRAKQNLEVLRHSSPEFDEIVARRRIRYLLGLHGKDGVDFCEETNGFLRWF
jgi:hypothetical protein